MPSYGISMWNFHLSHGCVQEKIVHSKGLGTILVRNDLLTCFRSYGRLCDSDSLQILNARPRD